MSAAVGTPTVVGTPDNTQRYEIVNGTIAIGASPLTYSTGGIVCSFANQDAIKATSAPLYVRVWSQPAVASAGTAQFQYTFLPGTTQANGVLQVFTGAAAQSGLAELSAGAVPAGVSGDTIQFEAKFLRV